MWIESSTFAVLAQDASAARQLIVDVDGTSATLTCDEALAGVDGECSFRLGASAIVETRKPVRQRNLNRTGGVLGALYIGAELRKFG